MLPKAKEDLHGFTLAEINAHFTGESVSPNEYERDANDIVASADEAGFSFKEVTFENVVLAVSKFSSQAVGDDGIPQNVVAKALPSIGHHIAKLCNSFLTQGKFPDVWKTAYFVPLKKTAVPSAVTDFRPIALLSFLSKVLEKIVHTQIAEYLTDNKILNPFQTRFRQNHSTQTALLKLTEDIRAGIDERTEKKLITI